MTKGGLRWTDEQHQAWKDKQAKRCADIDQVEREIDKLGDQFEGVNKAHAVAHVIEPPAPSKYHNKRTNGYASKKEAKRAAELQRLAAAGKITDLREQVRFIIVPKAIGEDGRIIERASFYQADFVYRSGGEEIVEDCKGMRTPYYVLKRKLMLMVHGIRILET
jgi:hypothetical protein